MKQTVLTFITPVDRARVEELQGLLDRIQKNLPNDPDVPFASLRLLHFASLVLFEDEEFGPYLVFENNFDGPLDAYLAELYRHARGGLHQIYRCCIGYPAASAEDEKTMLAYLKAHVVRPSAYHIGNVGRSAERTRQEAALREQLEQELDRMVSSGEAGASPTSLREGIQSFARRQPQWPQIADLQPRQTVAERVLPWIKIAAVGIGALALARVAWRLLLPAAAVWVVVLRWKEQHDPSRFEPASHELVQRLTAREDNIVQNHLASLIHVKPGPFRRATLRVVLWAANLLARTATHGQLSGIPSIHFAHWAMIDNGRRLLFLSNYDGSWENYLDDFIDKASTGLTGIWSNTVGFPPTRFLVLAGARNGPWFKAWARNQQTYTAVWYSAYKNLTVNIIDNNSAIREGLVLPLAGAAVKEWLRRF